MIQLTLTLRMTTAQVVGTSVTVNNNSPIQDYVHPDDQTQPTFIVLLQNKRTTVAENVENLISAQPRISAHSQSPKI